MTFDVLKEPWIPVVDLQGQKKEMGLTETLLHAHKLVGVTSANALVEYGIQRMLCAFVMDMLHPEDIENEGCFDPNVLSAYLDTCRDEGVSFDLFDEKTPFMQCPYDASMDSDKNIKPVRELDYSIPSGNNHTLFDHLTAPQQMTPAEALRQLCAVYTFCTAGLKGPSGVNGAPPLYVLIRGKTLYETLLYSCVPVWRMKMAYDDPHVFWRYRSVITPDEKVAQTSVLLGMTFPTRRITLIPDEDGMVRRIYYQKGLNFQNYEGWEDPHVAYLYTKKGRASVKPQMDKDCWRSAGALLDYAAGADRSNGAPTIVQEYKNNIRCDQITLMVYGVETSNASYLGVVRSDLTYDVRLMDDPIKIDRLQEAIEAIEGAARLLRNALLHTCEDDEHFTSITQQAVESFYAWGENEFHSSLCPKLAAWNSEAPEEVIDAVNAWRKDVRQEALHVYDDCTRSVSRNGKGLLKQQEQRWLLIKLLNKGKEK